MRNIAKTAPVIQIPVSVPVNVCGNTVNALIAALNLTFGNVCINS
jgi:Small secreted domain (DUF320).